LESPAAIKVLEVITANPGIQSPQMAELTGCKLSHVKNVLTVISNAGKAVPIPGTGKTRHWYAQEAAGPYLEAWDAKRRKRGQPKPKAPTKRDKIAELAGHPEGVRASAIIAILGIDSSAVGRHVAQMTKQGRIFRSERPGARIRWFDTAEKAAQWAAMPPMVPNEWAGPSRKAWENRPRKPPKAPKLVAIGERLKNKTRQPSKAPPLLKGSDRRNQAIKAKPANDAPVTLHGKATDMRGTVDYSRAKITICPAPVSIYRHQYEPTSEAHRAYVRQIAELRGAA
jgi:hypothetical protein